MTNIKNEKICVVGLGYVGLPLAIALSESFECIGFDINSKRISELSDSIDSNNEHSLNEISKSKLKLTNTLEEVTDCSTFIVTAPTPITENNVPDLTPLSLACEMVGQVLKKGNLVIFESTVYPGCSEEFCGPILARESGLSQGKDFNIGYSPERINPGDKSNTIKTIKKVVSGDNDEALERVTHLYNAVITAGVHQAKSIKIAEASKLTENIQRDVNIALMNELAAVYSEMNIRISDVLEAAVTKWNFIPFRPGLVGGHCIGIDPYYLIDKANKQSLETPLIKTARQINENVVSRILTQFKKQVKTVHNRTLVMGVTFKENCNDLRNSKALELANNLSSITSVHVLEPNIEALPSSNLKLVESFLDAPYDCVIIAVNHDQFQNLTQDFLDEIVGGDGFIFDLHDILKISDERSFRL